MSDLHYPFENTPVPGEWQAVADGIYWLRMSLPMALDHINLYVLEDAQGWWIIDTELQVCTCVLVPWSDTTMCRKKVEKVVVGSVQHE